MDTTLEVTLDPDFLAAAEAAEREPSDIVAALMQEFVESERRAYSAFLHRKVEEGRRCVREGDVQDGDDVEAEFAEMRRELAADHQTET